jgi:hypothetical protein
MPVRLALLSSVRPIRSERRFEVVKADSGIAFACRRRKPCVAGGSQRGIGSQADWQAIGLCGEDAAVIRQSSPFSALTRSTAATPIPL